MVRVRRFEPGDAKAASLLMRRVQNVSLSKHYPKKQIAFWNRESSPAWLGEMADKYEVLVAEEKNKIAGLASLCFRRARQDKRRRWWVRILFVQPEKQGQGIGTKLLRQILTDAKKGGARRLHVNSSVNALGFYLRKGFGKIRRIRLPRGGFIVRMNKRLANGGK